jgi:hypothetical protein
MITSGRATPVLHLRAQWSTTNRGTVGRPFAPATSLLCPSSTGSPRPGTGGRRSGSGGAWSYGPRICPGLPLQAAFGNLRLPSHPPSHESRLYGGTSPHPPESGGRPDRTLSQKYDGKVVLLPAQRPLQRNGIPYPVPNTTAPCQDQKEAPDARPAPRSLAHALPCPG